ncbi:hypothetical protein BpHYR1_001221 [Brachionus plicatilis]|uniref:Uncharacterized protein n=1 Tax=Brachionus plicatilis TaxID=10195 RepID=A0A3M7SUQ5_BRAPC|nr:hypothetical protein BpHYR1_001221 [Brachionus plicatilis]
MIEKLGIVSYLNHSLFIYLFIINLLQENVKKSITILMLMKELMPDTDIQKDKISTYFILFSVPFINSLRLSIKFSTPWYIVLYEKKYQIILNLSVLALK